MSIILGSGKIDASKTDKLLVSRSLHSNGHCYIVFRTHSFTLQFHLHTTESTDVKRGVPLIFTYIFTHVTATQIKLQNISITPEDFFTFPINNHPSSVQISFTCLRTRSALSRMLFFFNYENMITHLQETWKTQNKVTCCSTL